MSGPSVRHEAAIPEHAQRKGFAGALAEHCSIYLGRYPFVPDGFVFEIERRRLTIYEVVVTHDIDSIKLAKIRIVRALMRHLGWMLRPMAVGPDGAVYPMSMRDGRAVIPLRRLHAAIERMHR